MVTAAHRAERRRQLAERVDGPVLLLGNGTRPRNLPANLLPFRQDSTFLYFTGCDLPDAAALLADGRCTLYAPPPADDDALWHGHVDSLDALRARFGVDAVRPFAELEAAVKGRRVRTLAVADDAKNRLGAELCGTPLAFGVHFGDPELVDAVIALRRPKSEPELDEIRAAARATAAAHRAVMAATRPGSHERSLTALFEAVLAVHGCVPGYGTILTQRGEVLHNHAHDAALTAGSLLLLDGGGEVASGYGADVTRTWPVSGRYDARQRAAYEAVLEAQAASIARCRPGVRYREVHDASSRVIARFLADEKLLRVSADEAFERHAHALFFPHGVGHLLGLDVHDLENFGDRPAYPPGRGRPDAFGTCYLRLDLPLEADWVVTVEPGFYVAPAILGDATLRERFRDAIDFDRAEAWVGFGGIRIEDDVRVRASGEAEVITAAIPKQVAEVEALVGSGPSAEERLC